MELDELSWKSYCSEDWYQAQTPKWDHLSDEGWVFTQPRPVPGTVGVCMQRGRDSAEFRVDSDLTREQINTQFLRLCQFYHFEVKYGRRIVTKPSTD